VILLAKLTHQKTPFYGFFGFLLRFFFNECRIGDFQPKENPLKGLTLKGLEKKFLVYLP
jgi:hypothetical protein